jgi:hypothetical protein
LEKLAQMQQAKQKADLDRQVAQAQIGHLGAETALAQSQVPRAEAVAESTRQQAALRKQQQDAVDFLGTAEGADLYARAQNDPKARALLTAKIAAHPHANIILAGLGGSKPMTAFETAQQNLNERKFAAAQKKAAAAPNKDTQQMQMLYAQATPSVSLLEDWYGQARNPNVVAGTLGRLPVVGNAIAGATDKDFQNAQLAAHNLAVQYLEAQPKARFQPSSIATMERLIVPEIGDSDVRRKQKLNTVQTFKNVLAKRAQVSTNPLDDEDNFQ